MKYSYFVSFNWRNDTQNGHGMMEVITTGKLKYKNLSDTQKVIKAEIDKNEKLNQKVNADDIIILNIILLDKFKAKDSDSKQ